MDKVLCNEQQVRSYPFVPVPSPLLETASGRVDVFRNLRWPSIAVAVRLMPKAGSESPVPAMLAGINWKKNLQPLDPGGNRAEKHSGGRPSTSYSVRR